MWIKISVFQILRVFFAVRCHVELPVTSMREYESDNTKFNTPAFPLRSVLAFVASGLDINGCVLSYF